MFKIPESVYRALLSIRGDDLSVDGRAYLMVGAVERSLAKGVKHFHPETQEELRTLDEVIRALKEHGTVMIENRKETYGA